MLKYRLQAGECEKSVLEFQHEYGDFKLQYLEFFEKYLCFFFTLEEAAPLLLQESYDNSGLLVGDPEADVRSAQIGRASCRERV